MQITQRIIATCIYISVCVVILLFTGTHINTIDVIQPDANVVYFHEVETRTEQPLQFRWAANDATLIFPYNSVGMQIFTFTATTPLPNHMNIRINDNDIGIATIQPNQFRTYRIITNISWSARYSHTTVVFHNDNPSLKRREISVGMTQASLVPLAPITLPSPNMWLIIVYTMVVLWAWRMRNWQFFLLYGASITYLSILSFLGITGVWWMYGYIIVLAWLAWLCDTTYQLPITIALTTTYRKDIDGIRAIAVLAVVGYHAFPTYIRGGFVGVDVFFVISGYLISQILLRQITLHTFTFRDFYSRRVRRIFPALFVLFGAVLLFGALCLLPNEYADLGRAVGAGAGFVANLQLYNDIGYFDINAVYKPLLHLWSLGIEEQFYLIWPVLLILFRRRITTIPALLITIAGISFVTNIMLTQTNQDAAFYWPMSRFWELAIGGLLAYQSLFSSPTTTPLPWWQNTQFQAILGAVAIGASIVWYTDQMIYPGYRALAPTIGTYLLIRAGADAWVNRVLLSHRVLVWIGLISFPLYLWHWSLLSFAYILFSSMQLPLLVSAGIVIVSIVLAALTYLFVEKPLRFGKYRTFPSIGIAFATFAIGIVGYGLIHTGIIQPYNQTITVAGAAESSEDRIPSVPDSLCTQITLTQFAGCWSNTPPHSSGTEYYFIGDSHADTLAIYGMHHSIPQHLTVYSVFGCLPFLGIERYTGASIEPYGCNNPSGLTAFMQLLRTQSTPNKRVIVLVSRYSYIEENLSDTALSKQVHFQLAGPRQPPEAVDRNQVFQQGLRNTLAVLTTLPNTTVVFMHQVPELNFTPESCNRWQLFRTQQRECTISRQVVDTLFMAYKTNTAIVLNDYPMVAQYDPMTKMCTATSCTVIHNDVSWYFDTNHVSSVGSELISTDLWQKFP